MKCTVHFGLGSCRNRPRDLYDRRGSWWDYMPVGSEIAAVSRAELPAAWISHQRRVSCYSYNMINSCCCWRWSSRFLVSIVLLADVLRASHASIATEPNRGEQANIPCESPAPILLAYAPWFASLSRDTSKHHCQSLR